jgi:hypothetical protein
LARRHSQDRREGRQPGRYAAFQTTGAATSRHLFADILRKIAELRLLAAWLTI